MYYDLHVHSTASDGTISPVEIIEMALETGLPGLALTDHDTMSGLPEVEEYLAVNDIPLVFIPGIELNTDYGESELHILGYFIEYRNSPIEYPLQRIRNARFERAFKMVDRLRCMGLSVTFEQVQKIARGDLIGRPHIAQALVDKGYVFSLKEAFQKYIGRGRPAYVPRYKFTPDEAIALVKEAGGISVLAHPGLIEEQSIIKEILAMGIEGLEVFYPEHSERQIHEYYQTALKHNLLITGGSDFHGPGSSESRGKLGYSGINQELFDVFIDYYRTKKDKKR